MEDEVVFTAHALEKFEILQRHRVRLSQSQVREIVTSPDRIERDAVGNLIAQGGLDQTHVLRVVYRVEEGKRIVITFYPGRRSRYED